MHAEPKIEAELKQIDNASTQELRRRWLDLYGHEAPKRLSRRLLELGVAYRIQELAYGGLSVRAKELLQRYADEIRETGALTVKPTAPKLKPGVRLLRAWKGQTHVVTVLDQGFVYRDERFRSLSEVARVITGVHRSGPAFFGLKGERKRAANGVRVEAP